MKKRLTFLFIILCIFSFTGCNKSNTVDYSSAQNWAYLSETKDKEVDVFFICPTVDMGGDDRHNMSLDDDKIKEKFIGATNMELGIYNETCNVFAPYYRQVVLSALEESDNNTYTDLAYQDVKNAFLYYYENFNDGRPFVLAGFSQGAEMGTMLMMDLFREEKYSDQLVAAYLIGWGITEEMIADKPWIKMAKGETDIGGIISFNSEAPNVTSSFIVPENVKTLSINPLNWKTDSTPASASQNIGACFTNYSGEIVKEIPHLTGAVYLDNTRGTLKVPDVSVEDYPPILPIFSPGEYHLYDYEFFYRNLQENVAKRATSYFSMASIYD
ncbi:MAG: DUF3089 domain-containing protein [Eubacteriaceae bacterium]